MPSSTYSSQPARKVREYPDGSYVDQNDRLLVTMLDPAGNVCEVPINTNRAEKPSERDHGYRAVVMTELQQKGWMQVVPPPGSDPKEWSKRVEDETKKRRAAHAANTPKADPSELAIATAAVQRLREELLGGAKKA